MLDGEELQLHESTTEVIIIGTPSPATILSNAVDPLSAHLQNANLGVYLEASFNFNLAVISDVEDSFYQLRAEAQINAVFISWGPGTVIHAFIISQLDRWVWG